MLFKKVTKQQCTLHFTDNFDSVLYVSDKINVNKDMFIVMYKRLHNFEDSTNDKKHTETH